MFAGRFDSLPPYAFPRLRALLDDIKPGMPPINLSLGEPRHPFPPFIPEILRAEEANYAKYPPTDGTEELRTAVSEWIARRYGTASGEISADDNILPLNGTREGLFSVCIAVVPEAKNGQRPAVLMPNPFYQCYAAAAAAAGADAIYVPATQKTNFLPDFTAVANDVLARTSAVYLCSPANPQGTTADASYWRSLFALADKHDFTVLADECYAEIYIDTPPTGALEVAAQDNKLNRLLAFHSLSKRSNLPGLRSGFVAGGTDLIARYRKLRSYGGAPSPLPVQKAAAAAWREESHVEANRALYAKKFDDAASVLNGRFGFYRPAGGFYLWLDVGDGETAAEKLWREVGVRVLPGRFLGRDSVEGDKSTNPGTAYIRVALVDTYEQTHEAMERIISCL